MVDIQGHIRSQLRSAALTERDLERPGAHVLVTDGEDLHVLMKRCEATRGLDVLEAEIPGYRGRIVVEEEGPIDLGDLGEWRDFVVTGLNEDAVRTMASRGPGGELRLFSPSMANEEAGAPFFASVDLAFLMCEVLNPVDQGTLAVRPVPTGEREGKRFIELTAEQRPVLRTLLGHWFDDVVPEGVLVAAAESFRKLQAGVANTGIIGARTLGLQPARPKAPYPDVEATREPEAAGAHGLSADTIGYLEAMGIEIPRSTPAVEWAENAIDTLPGNAPDAVAHDLRELFVRLQGEHDAAVDSLFETEPSPSNARPTEIVFDGERSLRTSIERRLSQVRKGLEGLGVPAETERMLAEELAVALRPSKRPALLLVAGEDGSAAEPLFDLAIAMTGNKPLRILGQDLVDPGWPALFGHNRGIATESEAWLSSANLERHRDTPADHVPIAFEGLEQAGAADPEARAHHQGDLLARLAEMVRTGIVNVHSRTDGGPASHEEVALANVVIPGLWRGPASELRNVLRTHAETSHLAERVIELEPYGPEHAVNALLRRVKFELEQHFAPRDLKIDLDDAAQSGLEAIMKAIGPAEGLRLLFEPLRREIAEAVEAQPAKRYAVAFSGRLTPKERQQLERGIRPKAHAVRWFGVRAV